jgi:hypothetical protein
MTGPGMEVDRFQRVRISSRTARMDGRSEPGGWWTPQAEGVESVDGEFVIGMRSTESFSYPICLRRGVRCR